MMPARFTQCIGTAALSKKSTKSRSNSATASAAARASGSKPEFMGPLVARPDFGEHFLGRERHVLVEPEKRFLAERHRRAGGAAVREREHHPGEGLLHHLAARLRDRLVEAALVLRREKVRVHAA